MLAGYIDAHCHLSDPRFEGKLDRLLEVSARAGVHAFILGGVDPSDWERQRALKVLYPSRVFPVFGVHPWFVDARAMNEDGRREVESALSKLPGLVSQCVAVGELGLDFGAHRKEESRPFQREVFERQIEIAKSAGKPMVLHVVKAHDEAIRVLRAYSPFPQGGWVHAFSGSWEVASRYLDLGLTISIGGAVARVKGYETLKKAAARLPADRWVVESDSPDLKPDGYEGFETGLNDPGCLPYVAQALGNLRGETAEGILATSRANLIRLLGPIF